MKILSYVSCEGKVRYDSYKQAETRMRLAHAYGQKSLSIYRCPVCKQFHIGHRVERSSEAKMLKSAKAQRRQRDQRMLRVWLDEMVDEKLL